MMMRITPESMSRIPQASRAVNGSSKRVTPMATAVSGSRAPSMAVGVYPMMRTATDMVTRETTVGRMANREAKNHI